MSTKFILVLFIFSFNFHLLFFSLQITWERIFGWFGKIYKDIHHLVSIYFFWVSLSLSALFGFTCVLFWSLWMRKTGHNTPNCSGSLFFWYRYRAFVYTLYIILDPLFIVIWLNTELLNKQHKKAHEMLRAKKGGKQVSLMTLFTILYNYITNKRQPSFVCVGVDKYILCKSREISWKIAQMLAFCCCFVWMCCYWRPYSKKMWR